jgi:hypothetical protein
MPEKELWPLVWKVDPTIPKTESAKCSREEGRQRTEQKPRDKKRPSFINCVA